MKNSFPLLQIRSAFDELLHSSSARRTCVRCGNTRFERLARSTFAQMQVLPFFNLYPWRCVICGRLIYRTLRINAQDKGDWG